MQSYKIKKIVQLGLIFERSHSLIYGGQNQQCIINKTEEPFCKRSRFSKNFLKRLIISLIFLRIG